MKLCGQICVGLLLGAASAPLWSQVDNPPTQPVAAYGTGSGTDNSDSRMLTPPPVSGQSYPTSGTARERSNYVRAGLAFTSAYTDNAVGSLNGKPVSDISYSVAPFIGLDETTSRLHLITTYAPGFTFYQKTSSRNEADQNVSLDLQYRLSPHVTFSARDGFQKSSSVFNQPDLASAGAVSGGAQEPNLSVIAPIAAFYRNAGNVGIAYQFAANGMLGANGTFTNLHYPNQADVSGLFDSSSQGGSVFASFRISKMHYIGASYQYQRLMSYPTEGQNETQTHTVFFFYTLYATSRLSVSAFGGPQLSDTVVPPTPPLQIQPPSSRAWNPAVGGSINWQSRLNSFALSYSHVISGGGGLMGAVHMDSATALIHSQITRNLSASLNGGYAQNDLVASSLGATNNGHTVSGTAELQRQIGQSVSVQAGYTRLHQNYGSVAVLSVTPNTNREFVSISYQFSRPLGR
jgi:hypothetical protein